MRGLGWVSPAEAIDLFDFKRQIGGEVLRKDLSGRLFVWTFDLDLDVESTRPEDGRVD